MAKNTSVAASPETQRAQIEARRGIARDKEGRIIRSAEWKKQRVQHLKQKRADCQQRIKNIDAETRSLTK